MDVIYSIHAKLGGTGTGTPACHAVRGLERHGYLKKVICTSSTDYVDKNKIRTASTLLNHAPSEWVRINAFDLLALRHVERCDVFYGWGGAHLYQSKKAKKLGAKIATSGASTHCLKQDKLLKEEYAKFNMYTNPTNPLIINKCLKEYNIVDLITASSKFVYDSFIEYGISEDKLRTIPFGVDTNKFKPKEKQDKKFRVLFVGLISLRKGVHYLLQAWEELNLKDAELILLGKVLKEMSSIIKYYKNRTNFTILNWVDDLPDMYSNSSIFVLPSIEEGSALVTYEAMACGIPQIVTENSGSIAIDGKHGFIIPIRDVAILKEKILYFYDNQSEIGKMSKESRKYVERFTWEYYESNFTRAIEELI